MSSSCSEVRELVLGLLLEPSPSAQFLEQSDVDDFLLAELASRIGELARGRQAIGPYTAGHGLRALLERALMEGGERTTFAGRIRDTLADLVRKGPAPRDVVVLSILEHVLSDDAATALFSSWSSEPLLAKALEEGRSLARGG